MQVAEDSCFIIIRKTRQNVNWIFSLSLEILRAERSLSSLEQVLKANGETL